MAKAKNKTLLGTGLAALCSHIKQCNTCLTTSSPVSAPVAAFTPPTMSAAVILVGSRMEPEMVKMCIRARALSVPSCSFASMPWSSPSNFSSNL